jgi:hypothetical protein
MPDEGSGQKRAKIVMESQPIITGIAQTTAT